MPCRGRIVLVLLLPALLLACCSPLPRAARRNRQGCLASLFDSAWSLGDDLDGADWCSKNRRLLNTEKIFFKAEGRNLVVTVEPEGVVAKPNVPEREHALFNVVCDELMLGIPVFTWWVGIAALLCIVLALLAPLVFPLHKLLNY